VTGEAATEVVWRGKGRTRERLLVVAGEKCGKSSGYLSVAARCLGPDDTMYIIDADNGLDALIEEEWDGVLAVREEYEETDGQLWQVNGNWQSDDGRLVVYHTRGWEGHIAALEDAFKRAKVDDWIVVDSMSHLWEDIQTWYIEQVHGKTMPEWMMEYRVNQVKAGMVERKDKADTGEAGLLIEWPFVNGQWKQHVAGRVVNARCHLYLIAEAKSIRTDGKEAADVKGMWSPVGFKPATQKRVGFNVRTCLALEKARAGGGLRMTVVGDRGREGRGRVENKVVAELDKGGLAKAYLWEVAEWRPTRVTARGEGG